MRSEHKETLSPSCTNSIRTKSRGSRRIPKTKSVPPTTGARPLPEDTGDVRRRGLPSTPTAEVLLETPPALLASSQLASPTGGAVPTSGSKRSPDKSLEKYS